MSKTSCLFILGTRPEAIKLAPVIKEFEKYPESFTIKVCVTAQHREMLDQVLRFFEISPDYDLNVMKENQDLISLSSTIMKGLKEVLEGFSPEYVFVQGDTTSCMIGALCGFYFGAKICHIEAGLRTYDRFSPYPEEINRQLTTKLADYHFAPTEWAKQNLLSEGIDENNTLVTGNTVIDALKWGLRKIENQETQEIQTLNRVLNPGKKLILVTGHRRENFGKGFQQVFEALKQLAENPQVQIIYPVHFNPNVQEPAYQLLQETRNIHLIEPLPYEAFIWLMNRSYFILSDSGGIQEEAPGLGKPVLVMRDTTERPEAIEAGTALLVGTNKEIIVRESLKLLNNSKHYEKMSLLQNPYGDGEAASRILEFLLNR